MHKMWILSSIWRLIWPFMIVQVSFENLFQLQLLELRTTNYELDGKCKKLERGEIDSPWISLFLSLSSFCLHILELEKMLVGNFGFLQNITYYNHNLAKSGISQSSAFNAAAADDSSGKHFIGRQISEGKLIDRI